MVDLISETTESLEIIEDPMSVTLFLFLFLPFRVKRQRKSFSLVKETMHYFEYLVIQRCFSFLIKLVDSN